MPTMATFIQDTSKRSVRSKRQQTLEEVAEEVLNGMFCHYEPPQQSKSNGILRSPRSAQNTPRNGDKSVRWSDEPDEEERKYERRPMDFAERVDTTIEKARDSIVNAGITGGCISPNSVPHRESKALSDVVYDDTGIPIKTKPSAPEVKLPACIPPPSRREIFIPELCGVRINCLEDEPHLEELAKSEAEARANNYYMDMNDGNNSIMGSDSEEEERDYKPKNHRKNHRKKGETKIVSPRFDVIEAVRSGEEETSKPTKSPRFRLLRAMSPARNRRASGDWDEDIPLVPVNQSRAKSPSRRFSLRSRRESSPGPSRRSSSRERRLSQGSRQRPKSPSARMVQVPHPGLHPAHPLNQGAYAQQHYRDNFADEKQSLITAHRQVAEAQLSQKPDFSDKESFIGAYRQSFGDIPPPPPPPPPRQDASWAPSVNMMPPMYQQMPDPSANKAETASMIMSNGDLMQANPTVPRRQSYGRVGGNLVPITEQVYQTQDPPLSGRSPKVADKAELVNKEDDLTWEERTRQAWERLRGGMSSLGLDMSSKSKEAQSDAGSVVSNSSRQSNSSKKPPGILKQSSYEQRRVTFGADQEHIFHDDRNENLPMYDPQSTNTDPLPVYPTKQMIMSPRKTKKKFKGVKIITGLFNRGGNKKQTKGIRQTMSNDTAGTEIASSQSMESNGTTGSSKVLYSVQYNPSSVNLSTAEPAQGGEVFSV